jgi:hypothetical protein
MMNLKVSKVVAANDVGPCGENRLVPAATWVAPRDWVRPRAPANRPVPSVMIWPVITRKRNEPSVSGMRWLAAGPTELIALPSAWVHLAMVFAEIGQAGTGPTGSNMLPAGGAGRASSSPGLLNVACQTPSCRPFCVPSRL